ncbi:hypothetical protein UG55_10813 [Frankia sp. EI5c]|nr:hypothetical protein UG55_10813 [Frankia sp. EI5c]
MTETRHSFVARVISVAPIYFIGGGVVVLFSDDHKIAVTLFALGGATASYLLLSRIGRRSRQARK